MSKMQAFRSQLHPSDDTKQSYIQALTRLTQADLGQMKALEGAPAWSDWTTV